MNILTAIYPDQKIYKSMGYPNAFYLFRYYQHNELYWQNLGSDRTGWTSVRQFLSGLILNFYFPINPGWHDFKTSAIGLFYTILTMHTHFVRCGLLTKNYGCGAFFLRGNLVRFGLKPGRDMSYDQKIIVLLTNYFPYDLGLAGSSSSHFEL